MEKLLCILYFRFLVFFFFFSSLMVILWWLSGWCLMSVPMLSYDKDAEMFCSLQTSHRVIVNNMHVLGTLLTKSYAYKYTV